MRKIMLFVCLALLLCIMPASALEYSIGVDNILPADTLPGGSGVRGEDYLDFIITTKDGKNAQFIDAYSGITTNVLMAHTDNIHSAILASNDKIYYVCDLSGSTYYLVAMDLTAAPLWYNGEYVYVDQTEPSSPGIFDNNGPGEEIVVIDSGIDPTVSPKEYGDYIYYIKSGDLYRIKKGQNIVQLVKKIPVVNSGIDDFCFINDTALAYSTKNVASGTVINPTAEVKLYILDLATSQNTQIASYSAPYSGINGNAAAESRVQKLDGDKLAFRYFAKKYYSTTIHQSVKGFIVIDYSNLASIQTSNIASYPTDVDRVFFGISSVTDVCLASSSSTTVAVYLTEGYIAETSDPIKLDHSATVSWDKLSYHPGDVGIITGTISNMNATGYTYSLRLGDSQNIKQTVELSGPVVVHEYTFPSTSIASTWIAQILATDKTSGQVTILNGATTSLTTTETYSISFSQDVYAYGDTMQINYASLPTNTQIYLRGTRETSAALETVYSQSYYRTGAGTISLAIPSQTATDYAVFAISNNYTLAKDYCKVAVSSSQVTLSGVVRDAETGARIEGAHVMLDSLGPYTNELGSYSMIRDTGTYYFVVSADGYQTYTTTLNLFSNTVRNVYLTPASFPGNIYGTVTDYKTGERLSGVLVTVKNSTVTKSSLTGSSGFYSVEDLVDNETYSITATLSGYDAYSNSSVTVGQVSFLDIKLIPEGYSGPGSGEDGPYSAGHEWTDEEMLKEARKIVFPVFIIVLLFWVFEVIGGKK